MADFTISLARAARKDLERLHATIVNRIFPKIEALAKNPRPSGCLKLKGSGDLWRVRVGDYRILYSISDAEEAVDIIAIRHRREAYE
jgi:mRNA interferase RelE/StbE